MDSRDDAEPVVADPRLAAIPDSHGHAKGEHKPFLEERPIPYTARMLFLWFFHACRRGSPRFMMVADHMNYLTFEDPAAVNLVRRALKLAQAGDLFGAAETAGVEVGHAKVVSDGLRRGMRYSIGAEVDNDPRSRPDAQNIVDAMKPDGMVRSVHFLPITHPTHGENWMWAFDNPEFKDLYEVVGTEAVWEIYMTTLLDAVEKLPGNIVGHFYVPAVFGHWPGDAVLEGYEDKLVDACAERGMAIELNSRYIYKHYLGDEAQLEKFRTAHVRLMRKAKEKGVEIAVGSDAHSPKDQGRAFQAVLALLDEVEINEIAFPIGGRLARVALRASEEFMKQFAPPEPEPPPAPPEPAPAPAPVAAPVKAKKPRPSRSKAALAAAAEAAGLTRGVDAADLDAPDLETAHIVPAASESTESQSLEREPVSETPAVAEAPAEPRSEGFEAAGSDLETPIEFTSEDADRPAAAAEPEPEPEPEEAAEPATEPEPVATPEPVAETEPVAGPAPSAERRPEPAAVPEPEPDVVARPTRKSPARTKAGIGAAGPHAGADGAQKAKGALEAIADAVKSVISSAVGAIVPHDGKHEEAAHASAKTAHAKPAAVETAKSTAKPAKPKAASGKAPAPKPAGKKRPATKAPAPAAKLPVKAAAKRAAPSKKAAAKKPVAKTAAKKKAAPAKSVAKKSPPKAAAKKSTVKKAPAKKIAASKKSAPKKATPAKKPAAKKTAKRPVAKAPAKKPARRR